MATFSLPHAAILGAVILWAAQVGGTTFPATVEVDLIFPRNDTYAPSSFFPIVFAYQNAALAPSLDPSLNFKVWDIANRNNSPSEVVTWTRLSRSDPEYDYIAINLNTTDNSAARSYAINWTLMTGNCSNGGTTVGSGPAGHQVNSVVFTIQSGAQQPDLVAATADNSSCASISHVALNLTGTQNLSDKASYDYHSKDTCALLSDVQPLVPGNPCAVQVNSSTASSISAAITSAVCRAKQEHRVHPYTGWPCEPNGAPGRWDTRYTGYTVWTTVFGALMAAFVVMECL